MAIGLDERGRRLATGPCLRCGREVGRVRLRPSALKDAGLARHQVETSVNGWHGQEVIPFPRPDGLVALVPVLGEAS